MAHLGRFFIAVGSIFISATLSTAATLTVDLNGGADYPDIQAAIDAAKDGDTVLVKPGEYVITEPIDFNRLHDPENPASPPVKNIVVKSEGGAEVTTIRMAETPANFDRASVVVFENGEGSASVFEGFAIIDGMGTKYGTETWEIGGGGICCKSSSPTLTNCTISGNSSRWLGGGVSCWGGSPNLTNCTISWNSALLRGGGIYSENSSPTLANCTISGNVVFGSGGGVFCVNSSSVITNCTISGNLAHGYRTCESGQCWYIGGQGEGGGVYCYNSTPTLTTCTISGNWCELVGGGICCINSAPTLISCTISGNSMQDGGCVYCLDSSPTLTNCTISENSAESDGGLLCIDESSPKLTNCIVWGNTPESVCGNVFNCLTDQDPLFIQPGEWVDCGSSDDPGCVACHWDETFLPIAWHRWIPGDYHLQPGSPCIDAGTSEGAPATDIEGHGRPCGKGVDIGAYEFGDCAGYVPFQRGDANGDTKTDITDAVATLGFLFLGQPTKLDCHKSADVDDSGKLDITDAVFLLSYLFLSGDPIHEPLAVCGVDPTLDELPCESFAACP